MLNRDNKGFGLIEALIGLSILITTYLALLNTGQKFLALNFENSQQIEAAFLVEEGIDAIRSIRDDGNWNQFFQSSELPITTYLHFDAVLNKWYINNNSEVIDNTFYRGLAIDGAYRHPVTFNIFEYINPSPVDPRYDPNTKKFTVTVSWKDRHGTTTRSVSQYLTNMFNE